MYVFLFVLFRFVFEREGASEHGAERENPVRGRGREREAERKRSRAPEAGLKLLEVGLEIMNHEIMT